MSKIDSIVAPVGRQKRKLSPKKPKSDPPRPTSAVRSSSGRFTTGHKSVSPQRFKKGHPKFPPKDPLGNPIPPAPRVKSGISRGNTDSAKFRNDLFWVYKQIGGRDQLKRLIAGGKDEAGNDIPADRAMLKEMLKLLLSLYSKELDAQIKREQAGGGDDKRSFIFIMDGLGNGKVAGANIESLPKKLLDMLTNTDSTVQQGAEIDISDTPEGQA